mmetsp:Transcript_44331/g.139875  ORF Transcript_44331/g.139875 Transcript_44331/m.139875 type:complete len:204 (-) Transcript_44331:95-706(-)
MSLLLPSCEVSVLVEARAAGPALDSSKQQLRRQVSVVKRHHDIIDQQLRLASVRDELVAGLQPSLRRDVEERHYARHEVSVLNRHGELVRRGVGEIVDDAGVEDAAATPVRESLLRDVHSNNVEVPLLFQRLIVVHPRFHRLLPVQPELVGKGCVAVRGPELDCGHSSVLGSELLKLLVDHFTVPVMVMPVINRDEPLYVCLR